MAELEGVEEHYIKTFMGADYEVMSIGTCEQLASRLEAIAKDIRSYEVEDQNCTVDLRNGKIRCNLTKGIIQ